MVTNSSQDNENEIIDELLGPLKDNSISTRLSNYQNIDYVIERESSGINFFSSFGIKYSWWQVNLIGIKPPIYNGYTSHGLTFSAINPLFANLVHIPNGKTIELEDSKYETNPESSGLVGWYKKIYCPKTPKLRYLEDAIIIAKSSIERYHEYRDRLDEALKKFEQIYDIDPITKNAKEGSIWNSPSIKSSLDSWRKFNETYPPANKTLRELIKEFNLDFVIDEI